MENVRGFFGTAAMLFFGATLLIGWGIMVILPVLGGFPPSADIGRLVLFTVGSLVVWRVAGGTGWGLAPEPTELKEASKADAGHALSGSDSPVPGDWAGPMANKGFGRFAVEDILRRVYTTSQPGQTLPGRQHVFRAFELTPLSSVKVVVLGQDPYPTGGQADGLAFSVRFGTRVPQSLERIFSNLQADRAVNFSRPSGGDLSEWARQGVLMLNSALTVRENAAGSHRDLWRDFTLRVLEVVNDKADPVVFLLWGDAANELADAVSIDETRHKVIRSTHPRRETSSQYPRFADTQPFSEANEFLRTHGRGEVNWTL